MPVVVLSSNEQLTLEINLFIPLDKSGVTIGVLILIFKC